MRLFFATLCCLGALLPAVAEAQYSLEYVKSWPSGPNQYDLAIAPNGNVYVIDINTDDVRYFSPDGQLLGQWGSQGTAPGQFDAHPTGICIDDSSYVFVVASNGHVLKFTAVGSFLSTFPVPLAAIGIARDHHGNIYTGVYGPTPADTVAGVRKWSPSGHYLGYFPAPDPVMLCVDDSNNVFVTNGIPAVLQKFSPTGQLLAQTDGRGTCAPFNILWGLANDHHGHILAVNIDWPAPAGMPNLMQFSETLGCLQAWQVPAPTDGPYPEVFVAVDVDRAGNLYVIDTFYHRVVKYQYFVTPPPPPPPLPMVLVLAPPRPNPSHGPVSLNFRTVVDAAVDLDIYDVVGQRIAHWRWDFLPAGEHAVTWNGRSDDDRAVASGVLFCQLTSHEQPLGYTYTAGGPKCRQMLIHLQ